MKLTTFDEYRNLSPFQQGYLCYMQSSWPGSEIPDRCPYEDGSVQAGRWNEGTFRAMLATQDGEE